MNDFQKTIGYRFRKPQYLERALTHSSYVNGKQRSNERLEFLGDSVLSVVVANYLFDTLTVPEGMLSKLRSKFVCEDTLYGFAKKIRLGDKIKLGKGEEAEGGRDRKSILADAFEAVIAAIYLDGGLESAREFILKFLPSPDTIRSGKIVLGEYKTELPELIQSHPEESVCYEICGESGEAHRRVFTANVLLNGQVIGTGSGTTKKEAEQQAAKEALKLLGYNAELL